MGDNHILEPFQNGENTKFVEQRLDQLDIFSMFDAAEEEILLLTQDVVELNERKVFLEGIATYFGKSLETSADELLSEVKARYKASGIALPKAVKGWFIKEEGTPGTKPSDRHNLYDFCIAMGMDYQETAQFFFKAFQTIPYNYKDRSDAVYFYCLAKKRPYSVIEQMLEKVKSYDETNADLDHTEEIGMQILDIDTDEAFLEYLQQHCYDRKHQFATAREKLRGLIAANKKILPEENPIEKEGIKERSRFPKTPADDRSTKDPSNSDLLYAILKYHYQDQKQRAMLDRCNLPAFPNDVDVSKALSTDKETSFEVLRKLLILMNFYNYYRSWHLAKKQTYMEDAEIAENYEDFRDSTNTLLAECGFVQMYVRNPYDWIILFCAKSPNPIEYLQDFIEKRYFGRFD